MQGTCGNTAGLRPASSGLALWLLAILSACSTVPYGDDPGSGNARLAPAAPVAYLHADTGGDSMLAQHKRGYVLALHVIDGSHSVVPVARCQRISGGSALGGGTERELEVALCEGDAQNSGEYWLVSEPGIVSVRRGPIDSTQEIVREQPLRDPHARASGVVSPDMAPAAQ